MKPTARRQTARIPPAVMLIHRGHNGPGRYQAQQPENPPGEVPYEPVIEAAMGGRDVVGVEVLVSRKRVRREPGRHAYFAGDEPREPIPIETREEDHNQTRRAVPAQRSGVLGPWDCLRLMPKRGARDHSRRYQRSIA